MVEDMDESTANFFWNGFRQMLTQNEALLVYILTVYQMPPVAEKL